MAELSREAMAVLELMPLWEQRDTYRESITAQERHGAMVAVDGHGPAEAALWQRLLTVMVGLGCSRDLFERAVMLSVSHADGFNGELRKRSPAVLLAIGREGLHAAQAAEPRLYEGLKIIHAPALGQCLGEAAAKRALWLALVEFRRSLAGDTARP